MEGARVHGAQPRLGIARGIARSAGGARRGARVQQVPGVGGRLGPGVRAEPGQRTRTGADGLAAAPGGAAAARPSVGALRQGHSGEFCLRAATPLRSGPGRGLSSYLARG